MMSATDGAVTPTVTHRSDDPDLSDLDRLAASLDELELHSCGPDKRSDSQVS
jgi:hypothetical protein